MSIKTHTDPLQTIFQKEGAELIVKGLTKDEFEVFSGRLPEYRMEREKNGNITIMAPIKGFGGIRENKINRRVGNFVENHLDGETFSPSSGFDLPDGATKSPDVAWVSGDKLAMLDPSIAEDKYLPIVPDFVAEIRSQTDSLKKTKAKMEDTWIANGVRLAWLIDPYQEKAYIYRGDGSKDVVKGFDNKLSGEDVLPGFELDLSEFRLFGKK